MTDFHQIESNLRQCFRALAGLRATAEIRDLAGVSILSLGAGFQMFNAAFLSGPVEDETGLDRQIAAARVHFAARDLEWSFWLCEDYLPEGVRRKAHRILERRGLRFATEMPGMLAERLAPPRHPLPDCEMRPVESAAEIEQFRRIGSQCFRVPPHWFAEVFDADTALRKPFQAWNGYAGSQAVATAATVRADGVIGIYNVATLPAFRARGFAEALVRKAVRREHACGGELPLVLQSTSLGFHLYRQMGFRTVARFRVWVS